MVTQLNLNVVCAPSEDVVAREIEGEVVIVPLVAGIGDAEDELYTLNDALAQEFAAPRADLESDVLGFASELTRRRILTVKDEG